MHPINQLKVFVLDIFLGIWKPVYQISFIRRPIHLISTKLYIYTHPREFHVYLLFDDFKSKKKKEKFTEPKIVN